MSVASECDDFVELSSEPLVLDKYVKAVQDPGAGAIATFSGTTRDTFEGKRVERLEYEAYEPMAMAELIKVCQVARSRWHVKKISMAHRTGVVEIGAPSVIVAVSSVHRREALEACHFAIDEIKARVPIWKKEVYEGGEVWKANHEFSADNVCRCKGGGGGAP